MSASPQLTGRGRRSSSETFGDKVARKGRRLRKHARRLVANALGGGAPETRVVFIMGAQRSGTRVPLIALESAPDILTFREGAKPYFRDVRLQPDEVLQGLFHRCRFPVLVLKPLCESHRAVELLLRFPESRIIWIYRQYEDTVRSASVKWHGAPDVVERLINGRLAADDWRMGGLTAESLAVAKALYRSGLNLHHANAILWYLRSRLLLDLDLFEHPRVLVVKYDDLSTAPEAHFPRLFDFIGEPLQAGYLRGIHYRSVRGGGLEGVPREAADACAALFAEIDRRYQLSAQRPVGA